MIISDDTTLPPTPASTTIGDRDNPDTPGQESAPVARLELPAQIVCNKAKETLAKTLSSPVFESFARNMQVSEITETEAVVSVANDVARTILQKSVDTISAAISSALGRSVQARIVVTPGLEVEYTPSLAAISVTPARQAETDEMPAPASRVAVSSASVGLAGGPVAANLNERYTMDNFVVGSNSKFCHSAALAVSANPGQAYNPLFLYGGVGLGKTHLMQAIGNEVLRTKPGKVVRYITCERFVNDVVTGIRENRMVDFRRRYRNVDVLLVDDIQFIEGKDATQEEFFHTFNALRDNGKQIVLSSDRPPKALSRLEERLRSRFEWGLTADIQPPDFETRVAILSKKCQGQSQPMPQEVLDYIASTYTNNIRELEGALLRLQAHCEFAGQSLDLSGAINILDPGSNVAARGQNLTVDAVINAVSSHFGQEPSDLRSDKRSHDLSQPRHIAMFLAYEDLNASYQKIGDCFGHRKHTSVKYGCDKVREELAGSADLARTIAQIRRQLRAL